MNDSQNDSTQSSPRLDAVQQRIDHLFTDSDLTGSIMQLEGFLAKLRLGKVETNPRLEALKENWETCLLLIDDLFLEAILSGDWAELESFIESCKQQPDTE